MCVYLDVAYVLQWFQVFFQVFLQVFQMHVSSVSSIFRHMLQMLHLDVSKVDQVLHFRPPVSVSPHPPDAGWSSEPEAQASATPSPSFSMLVTFGAAQAPM
jgi:hypothetical protein